MLPDFTYTVYRLTQSIVSKHFGSEIAWPPEREPVTQFVIGQVGIMPDYLRLPIRTLTRLFDVWTVPFAGHCFHELPSSRRQRHIQAWKTSSRALRRDFIRFYESLIVFGWNAEVDGSRKP